MDRTYRLRSMGFAAIFALGACSDANEEGLGRDHGPEGGLDSAVDSDGETGNVQQSEADAEQSDIEVIAATNGWTLNETRSYIARGDTVGEIAVQIDAERPGVLVGSAIGPEPSDTPRVYIKGLADDRIREIVGAASFEILIVDLQPFSSEDIEERQSMLTAELLALGYLNFAVGTDIEREGLMEATVEFAPGAPTTVDEILAELPEALRERTSIQLVEDAGIRLEGG